MLWFDMHCLGCVLAILVLAVKTGWFIPQPGVWVQWDFVLLTSHEHWLSGYNHHTCGRRPEVRIPGCPSSVLCEFTGTVEMAYWLCSPHLWQGGLGFKSQTNNSHVLSPPASYMGLACQDGYIALRCKNFELYDNLKKNQFDFFLCLCFSTDDAMGSLMVLLRIKVWG
jgi:hypothetical protein